MEVIVSVASIIGGIAAIWFIVDRLVIRDKSIEVTDTWWDSSSLKSKLKEKGYEFRWSNPDRVQERLDSGYKIIHTGHFYNRKQIKKPNGQVLVGKRND